MPARHHRRAVGAVTVGATALLSVCGLATTATAAPSAPRTTRGSATAVAAAASAHTLSVPRGLTLSDGSRHVQVGAESIDFGTAVHDLAWNPSGSRAAFVDGHGDLVVSDPDGGHRVTVAANPGGQTWSHPTWQVTADDKATGVPAKNTIVFAAEAHGSTVLESVKATGDHAEPARIRLNGDVEGGAVPQTGNAWPNVGGKYGTAVYENTDNGEVYIRDDYLRQQGGPVAAGSEPALAPNAEEVAFVRSVDGHEHLFVEKLGTAEPVAEDVTPGATTDSGEPAWSPDGRTLAFHTSHGTYTVARTAHGFGEPVKASSHTGLPAYRG